MRNKKLHSIDDGENFAQTIEYSYNHRGWLKGSISDLFMQTLQYEDGASPQYNGNISQQEWEHITPQQTYSYTYTYTYDNLNRLINGTMSNDIGREALTYDKMSNILTLSRTSTNSTVRDALTYTYTGNRLTKVVDGSDDATPQHHLTGITAYTHDVNGNMKSRINGPHSSNNITAISYNHLNLPVSVRRSASDSILYVYDATGRKLRITWAGVSTDYIDGIEWEGANLNLLHMEEGRIIKSGNNFIYEYFLKDHLGNNRSGFKPPSSGAAPTTASFCSDYYPFGLQYQQNIVLGSPENKYLYNGKELQKGTGMLDYGARQYDPVIGRWNVVDPLTDHPNQIRMSPYSAFWNNPILYDDPDGKCPVCPWLDAVVDVGFVLYDVGVLVHEKVTTGKTSAANWAALGADGTSILVPMSVGAGAVVRASVNAVNKVDNAVDVSKAADKGSDIKKIGPAGDAGGTVTKQIPDNWTKKTSDNKQGTKFLDPDNPSGNNVRVQSGNPNSPNPAQQKPYVKQTQNGKTVNVNGKQVDPKSAESHIPRDDFKFKKIDQ